MLRHRRFRNDLDAFVDGELNTDKHQAVSDHVDECPGCSLVTRQLVRLKTSLRRRRSPVTDEELAKMNAFAEQLISS